MDDPSESTTAPPVEPSGETTPAASVDTALAEQGAGDADRPEDALDGLPGPAGPVRKAVLIGIALVGALLSGWAGARFIADESEDAVAVPESPTASPATTATPSPTASPTATATTE